jgi:hypothetical protein
MKHENTSFSTEIFAGVKKRRGSIFSAATVRLSSAPPLIGLALQCYLALKDDCVRKEGYSLMDMTDRHPL